MRNKHDMRPIRGIAAALAIGLLAGCGPSKEPGANSPQAERTEQADAATPPIAAQGQASLPDGFPEQFPLPPDFVVTEGLFTPSDAWNQGGFLVRGHSATEVAELEVFFKQSLADAGFEVPHAPNSGLSKGGALVTFRGNGLKDGSVQIDPAAEGADLIIGLPLDD